MKIQWTWPNRILRTTVILACILVSALAIATEPSLNEQLVQAAKSGDLEQVKTLVARGADVNTKDDRKTVLMWAVDPRNLMRIWPMLKEAKRKTYLRSGNLDLVKFLVDQGADVNVREDIRDYIIESGPDWFKCLLMRRHTALTLAAGTQNVEIMEFLIDKGADMNVKNECGMTALMHAANLGRPDVMKSLIRKGADINVKDKKGKTALIYTIERRHINQEVVKMLLDKGADINAEDKDGRTALMEVASNGDFDVVKLFVDKGADVNVKDKNGWTALIGALNNSDLGVMKLLADNGADVNARSKFGRTALTYAAISGNLEATKLLIDKGADVNVKDKDGLTPLSYASTKGMTEVVQYLKSLGAK